MMKKILAVALVAGIAVFAVNCGNSEQKKQAKQAAETLEANPELAAALDQAGAANEGGSSDSGPVNIIGVWKSDATGAQIEFTADKFFTYNDGKKDESGAIEYKIEKGVIKFCGDGICADNGAGLVIVDGKPNFGGRLPLTKVN
ncbi:MAG: hypothetical protein FWB85_10520 [Chitinispirillia bacterium]|nr:hypothetical protein [Chitinispirillia bacterium]MCL2242616.1 hypothetical protein [Chitinispirillia bacterium]